MLDIISTKLGHNVNLKKRELLNITTCSIGQTDNKNIKVSSLESDKNTQRQSMSHIRKLKVVLAHV